jgi:hypothetical protein
MGVLALEGIVESGKIRLISSLRLPEKARVFVVIPEVNENPVAYVHTPHLRHPEQAADFRLDMTEDQPDASI